MKRKGLYLFKSWLNELVQVSLTLGRPDRAGDIIERTIRLAREVGLTHWAVGALELKGIDAEFRGDSQEAERIYREHIAAERALGTDLPC